MVYSRRWLIVAFPILLWLADAAVAGMIIYATATQTEDGLMNGKAITKLTASFLSITLLTNFISTGARHHTRCRSSD